MSSAFCFLQQHQNDGFCLPPLLGQQSPEHLNCRALHAKNGLGVAKHASSGVTISAPIIRYKTERKIKVCGSLARGNQLR